MSTAVYRTSLVLFVSGTLLIASALPFGVFAQEDVNATPAASNPYRIESVPGAAEAIGDFVVGPGKVDLTLRPGETRIVEIMVTNRTGESRIFNIDAEDAIGSQTTDTAIVLLGDDRGPYSMKDYVSVPAYSFTLDHSKRARIPITISIPENAEPGGLYGSVLIDTIAVEGQAADAEGATPQSAVVARIGTLFFITIAGEVERDGSLKDFSTVPEKLFYQSGPVPFGIVMENRGTIHLAPYGEVRITNMFDEEVGYVQMEPWFVLPESLRLREVSWDRDYLFGRYTATVLVNRGYDDIVDEMSYSFWVLPWKPIAGAFATLFIIFFLIRAFFRTFEFKRK